MEMEMVCASAADGTRVLGRARQAAEPHEPSSLLYCRARQEFSFRSERQWRGVDRDVATVESFLAGDGGDSVELSIDGHSGRARLVTLKRRVA